MANLAETQAAYDRHQLHVGMLHSEVADVILRLEAERDAARAQLAHATDDDAMTDIVQGALVELGVRTRLDTGESMREFCNSVAGEIIDALRLRFASARAGGEGET